jgi:hypothetical protein
MSGFTAPYRVPTKALVGKELPAQRIGRNECVDGIVNSLQSLQTAGIQLFDGRENHLTRGVKGGCLQDCPA